MAEKILVIRGGAIGDFILTLPAIQLLRDGFPGAHLEILGYRHIASLADGRHYAHAVRNIEYSGMAGFFNPKAQLDAELQNYFSGFQQILSYLYDPDGYFEYNLRRCGVKNLLTGNAKLHERAHAIRQLADPLEQIGLYLDENVRAMVFPTEQDIANAEKLLHGISSPCLAIHPGSGGVQKNWPLASWMAWIGDFLKSHPQWQLLVVGGESDRETLRILRRQPYAPSLTFIEHAELPVLAALLGRCRGFLGHDSGISHLAAATGCRSVLLFGPTNPETWAPPGPHVKVLKTATRNMKSHLPEKVTNAVESFIIAFSP